MKILTKIIGLFLIVFSFAYYDASPLQRGHRHGPPKHHYSGPHRPHYRKVVYHRPPGHYYKKHYYKPVRHRYYSHRPHRVYHSRPVVVVRL
ncbi:hypothetical protein QFZ37_002479 [Chryseobacterium ginsenosidimutans]|uniref:hypothetical protein n=1 Tax=Chryseobacterium ginsenosidimutans TaxID=687846 RepID=UPI00278A5222|nr:hypothetical protein [Chryseobacterium ginsenosidimutans]MDQ0594110.1 hypothetical protein [Chryseobacterium ginsenosidimutans]